MEKSFRLVVAAALIALGWWSWRVLFPGPAQVIRSRLNALARTASYERTDGIIPRALKAESIPDFFTPDAVVILEVRGLPRRSFSGREDLKVGAALAMQNFKGVKAEFLDIVVTLGPDKLTAAADLTARVTIADDKDFYVAELNVTLKKVNGTWLIERVETVGPDTPRRAAEFQAGRFPARANHTPARELASRSG